MKVKLFVLIKFLEEKKSNLLSIKKKKNTSHLRVLSVQWSCQTTSQLSPGLTSSEFSDPLGAEAPGRPHSWGHWVMSMLSPPYVPWAFPSGSLRVSKSQTQSTTGPGKWLSMQAVSVVEGHTEKVSVTPAPATLTLLACTHQPLSVHMEVFPLKPCQSPVQTGVPILPRAPQPAAWHVRAQLTPQAAGADVTLLRPCHPRMPPTLVGECDHRCRERHRLSPSDGQCLLQEHGVDSSSCESVICWDFPGQLNQQALSIRLRRVAWGAVMVAIPRHHNKRKEADWPARGMDAAHSISLPREEVVHPRAGSAHGTEAPGDGAQV